LSVCRDVFAITHSSRIINYEPSAPLLSEVPCLHLT
jgi:hypothetical protein